MAYQINKTDGSILATVADSQIDTVSTDLTLIGKNYSGFGDALNENFVRLLENFASSSRPTKPLRGQLWFDTRDLKLKIYNGSQFLPVSSATIAKTRPEVLSAGDLWYDDDNKQLYFFDGNSLALLGPDYSQAQGLSGLKVGNVFDTTNQNRVITYLYNGGTLLGIFAKEAFTPRVPIPGFSGSLIAGFNASPNIKFNVTATDSDKLGGNLASVFVRNDRDVSVTGKITTTSNDGIIIGSTGQVQLSTSGANTTLKVKRISQENAVVISPTTRLIDFYPEIIIDNEAPPDPLNPKPTGVFNGDFTIRGNLTVEGNPTQITFNDIVSTVNDKKIFLAVPTPPNLPNDITADGGGVVVKGSSDHSLLWSQSGASWNSTEHMNLNEGREYKINGVTVLTEFSLGPSITSAPGISNFGVQDVVEIGLGDPLRAVMRLEGQRIKILPIGSSNLELEPAPDGDVVLIGSPKIVGLAEPTLPQDATTKNYVDNAVGSRSIVFSMVVDGSENDSYFINLLQNNLSPASENKEGTVARILCTRINVNNFNLDVNSFVDQTTEVFSRPTGTGLALTGVSVASVPVNDVTTTITRQVRVYKVSGGAWTFESSATL